MYLRYLERRLYSDRKINLDDWTQEEKDSHSCLLSNVIILSMGFLVCSQSATVISFIFVYSFEFGHIIFGVSTC